MEKINGYSLTTELSAQNAGFSRWGFCEKGDRELYIKEFLSPVYPADNGELSEKLLEKRRKTCEDYYRKKKKFYDALRNCRSGNIITIEDFFRSGTHYYIVTDRVESKRPESRQLTGLPDKKKLILIRSLLYSFDRLHAAGIIHGDIKPENILLKSTVDGCYTGKIVDFDSGFLRNDPPASNELQGDFLYLAPEAFLYMDGESVNLSEKLDIFALGCLFHFYWTGELPAVGSEHHYVFEAVLNEELPEISESIPEPLRSLIGRMLKEKPEERPSAAEALKILSGEKKKPVEPAKPKVEAVPTKAEVKPKPAAGGFYVPTEMD